MDILETITANTRREVAWQKQTLPVDALLRLGSPWLAEAPRSMRRALAESETGIIAEFKRRSPSKGWLHEEQGITIVLITHFTPNGPATAPPAAPVPTATPRWPRPRGSARCVCAPRCCASVCPPTKPF